MSVGDGRDCLRSCGILRKMVRRMGRGRSQSTVPRRVVGVRVHPIPNVTTESTTPPVTGPSEQTVECYVFSLTS